MTGIIIPVTIQLTGGNHIAVGIITQVCTVRIGTMTTIGIRIRGITMITIIMAAPVEPQQKDQLFKDHLIGELIVWWREKHEAVSQLKRQNEFREKEVAEPVGNLFWIELPPEQVSGSSKIRMDALLQEKLSLGLMELGVNV